MIRCKLTLTGAFVITAIALTLASNTRYSDDSYTLRTAALQLAVSQTSRVALQQPGLGFKYFADGGDTCYMFDGSLIMGTSADDLSMAIFSDSSGHGDPAIGRLYALSDITVDSTPASGGPSGYRRAHGVGCNRDSSIAFDVDFYAPRDPDSANFIIGNFTFYSGPRAPGATINDVTICYAVDWDVPDDSGQNVGGYYISDEISVLYQQGAHGADTSRFAAMVFYSNSTPAPEKGMILKNDQWLSPSGGYEHHSIWTAIHDGVGLSSYSGPPTNLHSMIVAGRDITIRPKASYNFSFNIMFVGQPRGGSFEELWLETWKAMHFRCVNLPDCVFWEYWNCGDANSDNVFDISDAVFLIAHIFSGGPAPGDCMYPKGKGDANGDQTIDISDAVYLIAYIFAGGPAPHCYGM